jgi:hypothetical protein
MRITIAPEEQGSGFELAFPGTYQAKVVGVKNGAGPKGPYAQWTLELLGVERNADGIPLNGKRVGNVFERTTLIEGSRWRLAQMASALGLDPSNFDTDEFLGRQALVTVDVEKDQGYAPRNVVKKFLKQ